MSTMWSKNILKKFKYTHCPQCGEDVTTQVVAIIDIIKKDKLDGRTIQCGRCKTKLLIKASYSFDIERKCYEGSVPS